MFLLHAIGEGILGEHHIPTTKTGTRNANGGPNSAPEADGSSAPPRVSGVRVGGLFELKSYSTVFLAKVVYFCASNSLLLNATAGKTPR